jgi:hypothetical protein
LNNCWVKYCQIQNIQIIVDNSQKICEQYYFLQRMQQQKISGVLDTMDKNELLTFNKLHHLCGKHDQSGAIILKSKCIVCGIEVQIEINRTVAGFGLNGGAIHLNKDGQFLTKCLRCHRTSFSEVENECDRFITWSKI